METLTISNFTGRLTRFNIGDADSGYAKYPTTFGNDPFTNPTNLTWFEAPTQIDPSGSVITDLIMASRTRLESGITYVYAIGHTGRLYKIQVNDPSAHQPNLDTPVLLATLTANSPTFKYGPSIQFYGATEKIYIGHDVGVTSINFDGTGEAFVGTVGSYTQSVPRPSANFLGVTYWGNGTNIAAIDSTGSVTTYSKLSPSFPVGTYVRDMDVSPDGNYLQIVVSRLNSTDLTSTTQDTSSLSTGDSYLIYWNGTDTGYTSYNPFNSYSINSNISFGPHSYTAGYDLGGAALYSGGEKILTLNNSLSPNFSAMFSTGNLVGFASPENDSSKLKASLLTYGNYDEEIPKGLFRFFRASATSPETDVVQIPMCLIVSNLFYGSSSAGYSQNLVGSAKVYFSTLETSSSPTTKYRLYKFTTVPTGIGTAIAGTYETQSKLFSKKVQAKEVRLYVEPLVANNAFTVALIGSDRNPIAGTSRTFIVGLNAAAGDDVVKYTPASAPTYTMGVRITNSGSVNWVLNKIEVDYDFAGSGQTTI